MKTSIIDISPPITYLAKFWFSIYGPKCCWPIELQDSLKCNISRKKWMMKFIFIMSRNIEIFYKLILPSWVCVSRHAQSTQNKKFVYLCNISKKPRRMNWFRSVWPGMPKLPKITSSLFLCNILRKKWKMKLIFLHADKHEVSHRLVLWFLIGNGQPFPKYPK